MKKTRILIFFAVFLMCSWVTIQAGIRDIPKKVNYRDARITDVGAVAFDLMAWDSEDPVTHVKDTLLTTERYVLWQSKGNIEEQAQARRLNAPKLGAQLKDVISTSKRTGSLMAGWLASYEYMVFKYEYPSVDAEGNTVMLSSIAACPTASDTKETRDVVIGTHITITSNSECPSNTTMGFDEQDWGILMSLAGGKKIKLGAVANSLFAWGSTLLPSIVPYLWGGFGIAMEVYSAEPSNNYNLVIMPDYEGYGSTSNRSHPYLYQELTARQVVDATRYGIELYNHAEQTKSFRHPLRSNFRTMSCGYSQGGSVALATHRFVEQNGLTDELHFVGSICGDGPYDPISTLMYYVGRDIDNKKMSMAVVLPLIIKGMLDSNPYMKTHKAEDYFTQEFLNTGIMNWLNNKQMTTDEIAAKWGEMAKNGETTIFDTNGKALMRDIMNEQCYNYFVNLYNQYSSVYTTSGVPQPEHRGVMEDLHLALASNDITTGWVPQHSIMLFHSTDDTVVPYDNLKKALSGIALESDSRWIKQHVSSLGHDHVDSGTDFFKSDDNWELLGKLDLRIFTAKHKLCELPWNGQTISSMSNNW